VATTTTATTNFSSTVVAEVKRRVLINLRDRYVHAMPGSYIPGSYVKGTNSFVYVTYADFAAATTALTEGTPPTDNALSISTESFSATQLGNTIAISDLAALQSPHNLAAIAAERLADNAAKTQDTLIREILVAGSSVVFANGTVRSAVSAIATGALVKRMVEELQNANVLPFPDGTYHAIIHPRVAGDIQRDTSNGGWVDIFKYTRPDTLQGFQTANYAGVTFYVSHAAKVFTTAGAASANVYGSLFFGPESFAMNDMQTLNAYMVAPGGDHSDPLGQKAIFGWKLAFGAKLLTGPGTKIWRLETASTNG